MKHSTAHPHGGTGVTAGLLILLLATGLPALSAQASQPDDRPDLIVVIGIDQLGTDLFVQWRGRFDGGLGRLAREGVVYPNAFHSHAKTETCAGYATLLSGRHPSGTGMIANNWYDTTRGKEVYCTASETHRRGDDPDAPPHGPDNLRGTALGDWLKAADPDSRVVTVAGKARAAITMGGREPDAVFWYDSDAGFTTYVPNGGDEATALSPLRAFNKSLRERWTDTTPVWRYADARCRLLEDEYRFGEQTWASGLPPARWDAAEGYEGIKAHVGASPFGDEITLEAAHELIRHFELGQRQSTDLLAIGLVATDRIGHRFGLQGPEMCDQLGRLDRMLGAFIDALEARGLDPLVVLTSDHGGIDFPERLQRQGHPEAKRLSPEAWLGDINAALRSRFDLPAAPLVSTYDSLDLDQFYVVDPDGTAMAEPMRSRIVAAAVELIREAPGVADTFDTDALRDLPPVPAELPPDEQTLRQRFAQSLYPGRSGDIVVAFRPLVLPYKAVPGNFVTSHGSPWDYDRRVPLIFWRRGSRGQERPLPVRTIDIAPSIAAGLEIPVLEDVDGRCLPLQPLVHGACR